MSYERFPRELLAKISCQHCDEVQQEVVLDPKCESDD